MMGREDERDTYTVRETDMYFKSLEDKMTTHTALLHEIHEQVKRTNGRVSELEKWRGFITGAVAVLVILVLPIIVEITKVWLR